MIEQCDFAEIQTDLWRCQRCGRLARAMKQPRANCRAALAGPRSEAEIARLRSICASCPDFRSDTQCCRFDKACEDKERYESRLRVGQCPRGQWAVGSGQWPDPATRPAPLAPRLSVGMACYDDPQGVYFTVQALRMYHAAAIGEIIVVDNHPGSREGKVTKSFCTGNGIRYVPFTEYQGTSVRDRVFREAQGEYVVCTDSHVLPVAGSLERLAAYFAAHPQTNDLLSGPMLYDDLKTISTHFRPQWSEQMYGVWDTDPRGLDADGQPFEIPMQGLGLFACRKAAWPGFNPHFRGFGGEEGYIHEKFRQRGGKCLCLPFLRWGHHFAGEVDVDGEQVCVRPAPYSLTVEDKCRNYLLGWLELGLDTSPITEHFVKWLPAETIQRLLAESQKLSGERLLGIWYSNNAAPLGVMQASLRSIEAAVRQSPVPVDIITVGWKEIPGNPFPYMEAWHKLGNHYGIVGQILQGLYHQDGRAYAAVATLEHDVLYPPDYFRAAYSALEGHPEAPAVINHNFIGLRRAGYVEVVQHDEPEHQFVFRHTTAQLHFEQIARECLRRGAACLEPEEKTGVVRLPADPLRVPAVHINHTAHFTSHPNIYAQEPFCQVHPHWGDCRQYYD